MIDRGFSRKSLIAIAVIMFFGTALRFFQLDHQSFWHDEILTMRSSTGSFANVAINPQVNTNIPPFYYAIINILLNFGSDESLIRMPSALFGSVSILLFFGICYNLLGSRYALIGATLFAFSPFHIWYSQEARPYALLILLALGSFFLFQLLQRERTNGWMRVGFIFCTAATFYCHTVALAYIAVLSAFTLFIGRNKAFKYWLVNYAIIGALMIPAILKLIAVPPNASANPFESFHPLSIAYTMWAFSVGFTLGPTTAELHLSNRFDIVISQLPLILPVMSVFCWIFLFGLYTMYKSDKKTFWLLTIWFLFPLGLAVLGAVFTAHPFNVRYVILSFPPFIMGLTEGVLQINNKWFRAAILVTMFGVGLLSVGNYFLNEKYHRDDSRSAVKYLDEHAADGDLVIASAAYMIHDLNYYSHREDLVLVGYPSKSLPPAVTDNSNSNSVVESAFFVNPNKLEMELRKTIGKRKRFWLFLSRTFHSDPNGNVRRFCDENFMRLMEKSWTGTELTLYQGSF